MVILLKLPAASLLLRQNAFSHAQLPLKRNLHVPGHIPFQLLSQDPVFLRKQPAHIAVEIVDLRQIQLVSGAHQPFGPLTVIIRPAVNKDRRDILHKTGPHQRPVLVVLDPVVNLFHGTDCQLSPVQFGKQIGQNAVPAVLIIKKQLLHCIPGVGINPRSDQVSPLFLPSACPNLQHIGNDQIRTMLLCLLIQQGGQIGSDPVIGIHEHHILSSAGFYPGFPRRSIPAVFLTDENDTGIFLRIGFTDLQGIVRRAIVHQNDLQIPAALV